MLILTNFYLPGFVFLDQPLHLEGATDDVDPTFFDTTEEHLKALRRYRQYIEETGESKGFESARAGQSELHKSYTNYIDAVLRLQLDGVKELVLFLTTYVLLFIESRLSFTPIKALHKRINSCGSFATHPTSRRLSGFLTGLRRKLVFFPGITLSDSTPSTHSRISKHAY